MPGYALLVRGINVGGRHKLAMADLRTSLTELGFDRVTTLLQSGNAVFATPAGDAADLGGTIESALAAQHGLAVRCLVLPALQLQEILAANPLAARMVDGSQALLHFLLEPPDPGLVAEHDPALLAPGDIAAGPGLLYQWCPEGILASPPLAQFLERRWRVASTARNLNTVARLAGMAHAAVGASG